MYTRFLGLFEIKIGEKKMALNDNFFWQSWMIFENFNENDFTKNPSFELTFKSV